MTDEPPAVARLSKHVFTLYRWAALPLPETIEFVNLVQCIRLVCASSLSRENIAAEFNIRESIMYKVSTHILGERSVRHCCDWSEIRKFEPRRLLWESIEERQQTKWNEAFTIAKASLQNEGMSDFMWQKASEVLLSPQPLVAPFALLEQIHPRDEISMPDRVLGFELATQVPFLWTFANVAIVCTPGP